MASTQHGRGACAILMLWRQKPPQNACNPRIRKSKSSSVSITFRWSVGLRQLSLNSLDSRTYFPSVSGSTTNLVFVKKQFVFVKKTISVRKNKPRVPKNMIFVACGSSKVPHLVFATFRCFRHILFSSLYNIKRCTPPKIPIFVKQSENIAYFLHFFVETFGGNRELLYLCTRF